MKKFRWLALVALSAALAACGGGGGSPGRPGGSDASPTTDVELFTTMPDGLQLQPGALAQTFQIKGGAAPYMVSSSNTTVATVALDASGTGLVVTPLTTGSANVMVRDNFGKITTTALTVSPLPLTTTAPSTLTLRAGQAASSFNVSGGNSPYLVSSTNANVVQVSLIGTNSLRLLPIGGGSAKVEVKDKDRNAVSIDVTVEGTGGMTFASTAPSELSLVHSQSQVFEIRGGVAPYTVVSNAPNVATAVIDTAKTPNTFKITATSNTAVSDSAVISVVDGATARLDVTVKVSADVTKNLAVDAPATLTLVPGQTSPTFTISGGKSPYQVVSANQSVVTVGFTGGTTFTVSGISAGQTDIRVKDANATAINVGVEVSGAALFSTAPSSITLLPGSSTSFSIGGGVPAYSVTSSNPSAVTVVALGSNEYRIDASENQGQANLVVTDSKGTKLTTGVNVSRAASAALAVSPEAITGRVGETVTFVVSDGVAGYKVVSSDASIVQATMVGNQVSAKLLDTSLQGTVTISLVVSDALGQTKELKVTSMQSSTDLRLSPAALTISEIDTRDLTFYIYGGVGPFQVYSSNLKLVPVSISGNQVTVGGGPRCFSPSDWIPEDYKPSVVINVMDSLGASAGSTLTIHNDYGSGICP